MPEAASQERDVRRYSVYGDAYPYGPRIRIIPIPMPGAEVHPDQWLVIEGVRGWHPTGKVVAMLDEDFVTGELECVSLSYDPDSRPPGIWRGNRSTITPAYWMADNRLTFWQRLGVEEA